MAGPDQLWVHKACELVLDVRQLCPAELLVHLPADPGLQLDVCSHLLHAVRQALASLGQHLFDLQLAGHCFT